MLTRLDVMRALRNRAERKNLAEANRVILAVAGTTELGAIEPELYGAVVEALSGGGDSAPASGSVPKTFDEVATRAFAKWNGAKAVSV